MMIATKASESINQAVAYELQNIVKKYGAVYNSEHEGYAVLKEEVEEAGEACQQVVALLGVLWKNIRKNISDKDDIYFIKKYALALAEEAVQVAAVCERFEATIENKEDPPTYREDKTIL